MCDCIKQRINKMTEWYDAKEVIFALDFYPKDDEYAYPFKFKENGKNKTLAFGGAYCPFCGKKISKLEEE